MAKLVYKRVRGWTSGRSLPELNFVKYPPPPTPRAIAVRVLQNTWNLFISPCCFAEDGKKMYQELSPKCKTIVLLFKGIMSQ